VAVRLRSETDTDAIRAVNMCPNGNRTMSDNYQLINVIGIYENDSRLVTGMPVESNSSCCPSIVPEQAAQTRPAFNTTAV
jgi:hypothetical protein